MRFRGSLFLFSLCVGLQSQALEFPWPTDDDIIGQLQTAIVQKGQSLAEIGRLFDVGVHEMIEANRALDPWLPAAGSVVIIPTEFILPATPRKGLVLNLAEMRLYYFDLQKKIISTHPLGIGKKKWSTPLGQTVITNKKKDPPWYPPLSIRAEHLAKNDLLPAFIPGGSPNNPLGHYAFYLASKSLDSKKGDFLIHGTNRPGGVGIRTTHGCIRLFPEDIESLFKKVSIGTPVRIIHEPYKVGWKNKNLYLEAHEPLTEVCYRHSAHLGHLVTIVQEKIHALPCSINWASAAMAIKRPIGYPIRINDLID